MDSIRMFLFPMMIFSTISSIYSAEYNPLIFNPHTLEIYNSQEEDLKKSDIGYYAIACPGQHDSTQYAKHINRIIFMMKVVTGDQDQNTSMIKCEQGFELSVMLHSKNKGHVIEFGFEVYFQQSRFQNEKIEPTDERYFSPVSTGTSLRKRITDMLSSYLPSIPLSAAEKWNFLWLHKIEVRYSFSNRILKSMKYKVRPIKLDQLKLTCHDHELYGIWHNKNEHLDGLYKFDNQFDIFIRLEIPTKHCEPAGRFGECVKKHNLILPYQYQASSPDTISCSNLTTIPLWNEIPDVLMRRIEIFLIAVAQVLGEKHELIVLPGVLETLTFPSKNYKTPTKIYLNDKEKHVPVPKFIYKIVRHRTYKCDEKKNELCWFDLVIVIHNYPEFITDEGLCPIDVCQMNGWGSIQYLNNSHKLQDKSPFVYCCEFTADFAKLINFPLGKTRNEPLDLRNFPVYYDHGLREHHRKEIFNDVEDEFKKLVEVKDEEKL